MFRYLVKTLFLSLSLYICLCLCLSLHSFPSASLILHDQTSEKPLLILATFSLIHCVPCDLVSVLNTTETVFFFFF